MLKKGLHQPSSYIIIHCYRDQDVPKVDQEQLQSWGWCFWSFCGFERVPPVWLRATWLKLSDDAHERMDQFSSLHSASVRRRFVTKGSMQSMQSNTSTATTSKITAEFLADSDKWHLMKAKTMYEMVEEIPGSDLQVLVGAFKLMKRSSSMCCSIR